MQDGLDCRPATARICPKMKLKPQKPTRRKLLRYHKSSSPILAMNHVRYHPHISRSGNATNTITNTAFRYASCPPYPGQQSYPVEHFVYSQHTTVASSLANACTNALHPYLLNAPCVSTSQANLSIRHTLRDSAHPSITSLIPPPKVSSTARPPAFISPLLHRGISSSTYDKRYSY